MSSGILADGTSVEEEGPSKYASKAERFRAKFPEVEKAQLEEIFGMIDCVEMPILTLEELPSLGHNFKMKQNVNSELTSLI